MNNPIEIRLPQLEEINQKLDAILAELAGHDCENCVKTAIGMTMDLAKRVGETAAVEDPAPAPVVLDTPAEPEPAPEVPEELEPAPEVPEEPEQSQAPVRTISLGELRQKVVELAAKSTKMKDAVREIVKSFAPQVMQIPEDKIPEVWDKLEALEQGRA